MNINGPLEMAIDGMAVTIRSMWHCLTSTWHCFVGKTREKQSFSQYGSLFAGYHTHGKRILVTFDGNLVAAKQKFTEFQ